MKFFVRLTLFSFSICLINCQGSDMPFPCLDSDMCKQHFPENSRCRSGYCMCVDSDQYRFCTLSHAILRQPLSHGSVVSRICKHDHDCGTENIWCNTTNSQCQCKPQFVSDSNNKRCLPIVNSIGGRCVDPKQCLVHFHNTTCLDNQCVCADGFHHSNGKCWKTVKLFEACNFNQECLHVEYAECNNGKTCACSEGTTLNSEQNRCLRNARSIMHECSEIGQCTSILGEFSDCIDGKCRCTIKGHYVESIKKCIGNKELGAECTENYECYDQEIPEIVKSVNCTDKVCACNENYSNVNGKCLVVDGATTARISTALIISLPLILRYW